MFCIFFNVEDKHDNEPEKGRLLILPECVLWVAFLVMVTNVFRLINIFHQVQMYSIGASIGVLALALEQSEAN